MRYLSGIVARRGRRAPAARLVAAVALTCSAALLGAVSGRAAPVVAEGLGNWEVWLDAPLPHDVPPGSTLHVGFIMWDVAESSTVNIFGSEVRLHPAGGTGKVSTAEPKQDWPGHSVVDLVVPAAGFGRLEFGVYENAGLSGAGRTITLDFRPVAVAGVGPPPGIPLRRIGTVEIRPAAPELVGQPFDVDLTFQPRVGCPAGSIAFPDALTLRVRVPRAEDGDELTAKLVDRLAGRYRATVLVNQPGPYILEAAMRPDAPPDERFTETEARVDVETADAQVASAAPAAPAAPSAGTPATGAPAGTAAAPTSTAPSDGPGPPAIVLALGALVVAAGVIGLARVVRAEW